ncbi:MAG: ABC transporter ATP-binding protein [Clostridium sp.]|uniref:ABC transporter ATP-binding protein n=1 Tax=Clostridium sp. TaxID=1506 RepID=UPI00305DF66F
MKKILSYVKQHKLITLLGTISMLMVISADLTMPYITEIFIDDVITAKNYDLLSVVLWTIVGITLVRFVFGYLKEYLFDYLGITVSKGVKETLFKHIEGLSFSYFDKVNTGELMSRVGEDADNILELMGFGLRLCIENVIYFLIASVLLLRISVPLTIVALSTLPIIAYITLKSEKKMDDVYDRISDHIAELNTTAQENIAGVKLVKAFGREKHEILKFLKYNSKNYDLQMEHTGIWIKFFPLEEFLGNLSVVLVTCVGGILVIYNKISIGQLVAFSSYLWMLIWPMRELGWLINLMSRSRASIGKIDKILAIDAKISNAEDAIVPEEIKGEISFKNVSFKYNEENVLENINLNIKSGMTVAIMGTTGSGKSTLMGLLGRNYDATEGIIEVDGVNVKSLDIKSLRDSISIVPQDSFLFSDTIESNLRYGKNDATREEMEKAIELACAKEFVDALEEGYGTLIGERGLGLSGGQKQRLCIARSLLRASKILILDDSTSALDMETEYELLKNLYHGEVKKTTFIIAHRISAVKNADLILYMEDGRIVEQGNHEELLDKEGKYFEIYQTQFKDFLELSEDEAASF